MGGWLRLVRGVAVLAAAGAAQAFGVAGAVALDHVGVRREPPTCVTSGPQAHVVPSITTSGKQAHPS